ncbi:serine hydrolase domain-containing protein [Pontibacillus halophilus]|uniref:serine hydrolase domain-containing protein n=2 Tax=Pontibacillus halophilus TaxID=516704 RepID=UPI001377341D|nr:serine hydrolase domain-containing protein [Pontibacillus halophilus]
MALNQSERMNNRQNTRFGIASGSKVYTAVAVAQLVESGAFQFETKVAELLPGYFPLFDETVTVHHLLTHTSGIPDYFDESTMDDFEELWRHTPMYTLQTLEDFIPLFNGKPQDFMPGEQFQYNNAAFIVLGLIVERIAGKSFQSYVEQEIFTRAGMDDSGYFRLDELPSNTALGYIATEHGVMRTNQYAIPVVGGADGGAFVTAGDFNKFWNALFSHKLIGEQHKQQLLSSHVEVDDSTGYGYGVWMKYGVKGIRKYFVMGFDPGVRFHSSYYPNSKSYITITSNGEYDLYKIMRSIEEARALD